MFTFNGLVRANMAPLPLGGAGSRCSVVGAAPMAVNMTPRQEEDK